MAETTSNTDQQTSIQVPVAPVLVATPQGAVWLSEDGEFELLDKKSLEARLADGPSPFVCHARATARRLGVKPFPAYDILELYAFVRPAVFCLPTAVGIAQALQLPLPAGHEDEVMLLPRAAATLLHELATYTPPPKSRDDDGRAAIAWSMSQGGWVWGQSVLAAVGQAYGKGGLPTPSTITAGLKVWAKLEEWEEGAPETPPENRPVEQVEARARLTQLLGTDSEDRTEQMNYAAAAARAFMPREQAGEPHVVVAEAGTGIGKTLGYIAPASVWAEKNRGTVWISTYTRNLQRQLDWELDRLFPFPEEKNTRVVVRKGRENYLCLLNFEEAVNRTPTAQSGGAVPLGLMARWVTTSRDGDMIGGDFPSWLSDLMGRRETVDLTDTRGECTYSACAHYKKCFIEHSQRRARRADIVVANHALVMVHAALGGGENGADGNAPTRFVFDEGHHLFDAADSAFAAHLTGYETMDLRRWLVGAESGSRSRSRGLKTRIGDLIAGDEKAEKALDEAMRAAHTLPPSGWLQRIAAGNPNGAAEKFFAHVRQQVYARDDNNNATYSLETDTTSPVEGLSDAAAEFQSALDRLSRPLTQLIKALYSILDTEAETLDSGSRNRIDAVCRGIERRAVMPLKAWISMLQAMGEETPEAFVDWFSVERRGGNDWDVGLNRHWVDPTEPFTDMVVEPAHGVLVTSATLRDGGPRDGGVAEDEAEAEKNWIAATARTGANHLAAPAILSSFPSPFSYGDATRVLIVGDVRRDDPAQVSAAYRTLFQAAGGGGLGLFTAISRLRAVHERIAPELDKSGISLLAQHVDPLDTGTLVDIFRAEENTCLLGTDAVRDGVDVPGRSLRLIVFDRIPWPRPDILHRARRDRFGGRSYDEMLTRLKLKQAYGRLIRRATDRGIFVMLDKAMPSRLLNAFPGDVEIIRTGLAQATDITQAFLANDETGDDS
jgi:ATP-dependent DNA helicase DinG